MSRKSVRCPLARIVTLSPALLLLGALTAPAAATGGLIGSYTEIYSYGINQGRPSTSMSININNQTVFVDSTFGVYQGNTLANTGNLWGIYFGSGSPNGKYANNAVNPANNDSGNVMVSMMTYTSDATNSFVIDGANTYQLAAGLQTSGAMIKEGASTYVLYPTFVPGHDGGHTNSTYILSGARGLTNDNTISFTAGYNGGANHGVFYGNGTTTTNVANDTSQFTGNLDNSLPFINNTFNTLAITGTGATKEVLFRGSLAANGAQEGLYVGNGSTLTTIASTTGGAFKGFANAGLYQTPGSISGASAIDKNGDVAYRAILANGSDALYYYNASTHTSTQLAVADNTTFNLIYSVSLNDNGLIAVATAMKGVSNALWMYDLNNTGAGLQKLLSTGDTFDGHVIGNVVEPGYDIELADSAYNDNNELAVALTFTDLLGNGQDLANVYILDPGPALVPEPGTLALLALGGLALLRRARVKSVA